MLAVLDYTLLQGGVDQGWPGSFVSRKNSRRFARLFLMRRDVSLAWASCSQHCWMIRDNPAITWGMEGGGGREGVLIDRLYNEKS